jgi:mRNA-degrading endonuclease YafQ of YafQ-DinJ toxin-antitoxin module
VTEPESYRSLEFTPDFFRDLLRGRFSVSEVDRILRTLSLLDSNERHPSLRVHQLHDELEGQWSASASDQIRITFRRLAGGRKEMVSVNRHYKK